MSNAFLSKSNRHTNQVLNTNSDAIPGIVKCIESFAQKINEIESQGKQLTQPSQLNALRTSKKEAQGLHDQIERQLQLAAKDRQNRNQLKRIRHQFRELQRGFDEVSQDVQRKEKSLSRKMRDEYTYGLVSSKDRKGNVSAQQKVQVPKRKLFLSEEDASTIDVYTLIAKEERDQFLGIEEGVTDLASCLNDLKTLVYEQQTSLDLIEQNVQSVNRNVEIGIDEIKNAKNLTMTGLAQGGPLKKFKVLKLFL